jgi:hypothetical protein
MSRDELLQALRMSMEVDGEAALEAALSPADDASGGGGHEAARLSEDVDGPDARAGANQSAASGACAGAGAGGQTPSAGIQHARNRRKHIKPLSLIWACHEFEDMYTEKNTLIVDDTLDVYVIACVLFSGWCQIR